MTSKQVMLALALLLTSCASWPWTKRGADPLESPYATRQVWAVVPLRNESGTLAADGAAMADHLARQLKNASNIEVLPVNRVLAAMKAAQIDSIRDHADAQRLVATLGADYLLVGTISAYDPYDPPKIGLTLELFVNRKSDRPSSLDIHRLTGAPTDDSSGPSAADPTLPVSSVSAYLDAADPHVRAELERYAQDRSQDRDESSWRLYRINMDLYSEFVSYVMSWRLLQAERQRFGLPPASQPAS